MTKSLRERAIDSAVDAHWRSVRVNPEALSESTRQTTAHLLEQIVDAVLGLAGAEAARWEETYARDRALWSEGFERDERRAESAEAERDNLRAKVTKARRQRDHLRNVNAGLRARLAKMEALAGGEMRRREGDSWDNALNEMHDLGWMHDGALADGFARNPYRNR